METRALRQLLGLPVVLFFLGAVPAWAAATLENPAPGALKSGVGVISGWVCDADELTVSFDGGPQTFVPYGSERIDTAGVCGDSDNGFGLLWNYNELGDGPHTMTLYVDGMIQTQVNFSVQTLGTNFLRGVTGQGTITLSDGKQVNVQWEETTQGFTITGYNEGEVISDGGSTSSTSADAALNRMRGTWRFYYGDHYIFTPTHDAFDDWVFSDIETIEGYRTLIGDFASLDRIEWVHVSLTRDIPGAEQYVAQYEYVAFYEDVFDDDFGNTCDWVFFNFVATTKVQGLARSSILFDDGTCGPIGPGPGPKVTGFRVQGPQ